MANPTRKGTLRPGPWVIDRLDFARLILVRRYTRFGLRSRNMTPREQNRRTLTSVSGDQLREYLLAGKVSEIPSGWLKPEVRSSWQRCLDAKLDPNSAPEVLPVSKTELRELRERHAKLDEIAKMEVRNLYSQIAGSNFIVAFATYDAIVLETVADPSFLQFARKSGIVAGSKWQEQLRGTNALGCASFTQSPSVIHASEHFFKDNCRLTCVASPVFDHEDRIIGVIDASSDCNSRQVHTVTLIRMAALHIEAEMFRNTLRQHLILQFHNRHEFVHTLEAGLVALDWEGRVIAANRQARFFLQDLPIAPGQAFEGVFRTSFDRFLAESAAAASGQLTDHRGSTYKVIVSSLPNSPVTIRGASLQTRSAGQPARSNRNLSATTRSFWRQSKSSKEQSPGEFRSSFGAKPAAVKSSWPDTSMRSAAEPESLSQ
jgi:transcriptional regulator of acetoin/glycerol metabolism